MAGSVQTLDFAETQKIAANMIASTMCNSGAEALLDAQADLLKNVQTAVAEWLHRRREALDDAYRLVARMRGSRELNEIWQAQQDWAAATMQRLAADLTVYPKLFAISGERTTERAAHAAAATTTEASNAIGEMARRAAEINKPAHRLPKVPAEPKPAEEASAH